jgi:hypothetical protein
MPGDLALGSFSRPAMRNCDSLKSRILPYPSKAMLQCGDFPSIENQIQPDE